MTYTSGGLIQAADYNGFVSTNVGANVNAVMSTGASLDSGYGQSTLLTLAAGDLVGAAAWTALNNNITTAANHQGTSITSRTNPSAGQTIGILSALNTDLTNIYNNRRNASSSGTQYTAWTGTSSKTTNTGSGTSSWTITWTHTVTWGNYIQCFQFWNCGGLIKLQFNKSSSGSGFGGDTYWNNFITNVVASSLYLGGNTSQTIAGQAYTGTTKFGGSGTPSVLATGTGFAQLTTSDTNLYLQYSTNYPYTSAYVSVNARVNSTSTPTVLTFTTTWYQPAWWQGDVDISGGTATTGITFGTAPATVVTYLPPETIYLSNSWGTPTVAASVV